MASENPQNTLVVFRGPPRKLLSYEADIELDETYELEIDENLVQFSQAAALAAVTSSSACKSRYCVVSLWLGAKSISGRWSR